LRHPTEIPPCCFPRPSSAAARSPSGGSTAPSSPAAFRRGCARELWRIPAPFLAEAQDDATIVDPRQEEAGLDIVSDGEIRRESYSNRFATALDGVDLDNPGTALDRSGHPNPVPRIVARSGAARRSRSATSSSCAAHDARTKITVPGPFTMLQQAQNDFYADEEEAAMDYAAAVNEEIKDLSPPAPTSSRSTSPTCRRGPRRRAGTG
jgi:methionine synthase II (cobalamin-independent)